MFWFGEGLDTLKVTGAMYANFLGLGRVRTYGYSASAEAEPRSRI
jgi:hypothetical protein